MSNMSENNANRTKIQTDIQNIVKNITKDNSPCIVDSTQVEVQDKVQDKVQDEVKFNPFYVGSNGGTLNLLKARDIYEKYQKCITISLKDGTYIDNININGIFAKNTTIDELKELQLMKYFDVSECSIKILTNYSIRKLCNIVEPNVLNDLFMTTYRHDQIVVPFYTVYTSNVRNYVSVYGSTNSIEDVMKTVGMVQVYNPRGNTLVSNVLKKKFTEMNDGYWKTERNCTVPFEDTFDKRSFRYNGTRLDTINTKVVKRFNNIEGLIKACNNAKTNGNEKFGFDNTNPNNTNDNPNDSTNNDTNDYLDGIKQMDLDDFVIAKEAVNPNYLDGIINDTDPDARKEYNGYDISGFAGTKGTNNKSELKIKPLWTDAFENLNKAIRTDKNRRFFIEKYNDPISKEDIIQIYRNLDSEKEKVKFLTSIMTSKNHCHLAVNNKTLLELIRKDELFAKYRQLFSVVMGYAWGTFTMYEALLCTRSTKFSDFTFDIDTAHLLPTFPTSFNGLKHSPYFFTPLSDECIDYNNNFVGMHSYKNHEKYNGVTTREEAVKRFNIFCTGNPSTSIINFNSNVKWSISGSIIPACIRKTTPLFEKCYVNNDYDPEFAKRPYTEEEYKVAKWKEYFNQYYEKSDIDVMVETGECLKFINFGSKLIKSVCERFDIERKYVDIESDEKGIIVITPHFFEECIDDVNDVLESEYTSEELCNEFARMTFTVSGDNENVSDVLKDLKKKYFYEDYKSEKNARNIKFNEMIKDSEFDFDDELIKAYTNMRNEEKIRYRIVSYDISKANYQSKDTDICFYVNDFRDEDNQVDETENYLVYKFGENIKCKIHFNDDEIKRPVEIFMVNGPDPFKTVARFHLPVVRCYYQVFNGEPNFYILPSCVSSTHCPTSDMIYFAGSRNPCEIVLKYVTRGAGIILNKNERIGITKYCKLVDNNNGMYAIDNPKQLFGPKHHNNRVYCPGYYKNKDNANVDENITNTADTTDTTSTKIYEDVEVEYIKSKDELYKLYNEERSKYGYKEKMSLNNMTFIDESGKITPYEEWIVDGYLAGYSS